MTHRDEAQSRELTGGRLEATPSIAPPLTIEQIIERSSHCIVMDGAGRVHDAFKVKKKDLLALELALSQAKAEIEALQSQLSRLSLELEKERKDGERLSWFERQADTGACPSLIYDDNGNWAVAEEGSQNIRTEDTDDLIISHYVKADRFKPTIREAIDAAIDSAL